MPTANRKAGHRRWLKATRDLAAATLQALRSGDKALIAAVCPATAPGDAVTMVELQRLRPAATPERVVDLIADGWLVVDRRGRIGVAGIDLALELATRKPELPLAALYYSP